MKKDCLSRYKDTGRCVRLNVDNESNDPTRQNDFLALLTIEISPIS